MPLRPGSSSSSSIDSSNRRRLHRQSQLPDQARPDLRSSQCVELRGICLGRVRRGGGRRALDQLSRQLRHVRGRCRSETTTKTTATTNDETEGAAPTQGDGGAQGAGGYRRCEEEERPRQGTARPPAAARGMRSWVGTALPGRSQLLLASVGAAVLVAFRRRLQGAAQYWTHRARGDGPRRALPLQLQCGMRYLHPVADAAH